MTTRKVPKKETEMFAPVCEMFGTTPEKSRVLISEGRKVGFILSFGQINCRECFKNEATTSSFKDAPITFSQSNQLLIPDGFTIAVKARGGVYVGEIRYNGRVVPMYRFSYMEGKQFVKQSSFQVTPSRAFLELFPGEDPDSIKSNGKLLIGVRYSEPQKMIRDFFAANLSLVAPVAMDLYQEFINSPRFAGHASLSQFSSVSEEEPIEGQQMYNNFIEQRARREAEFSLHPARSFLHDSPASLLLGESVSSSNPVNEPGLLLFSPISADAQRGAGKFSSELKAHGSLYSPSQENVRKRPQVASSSIGRDSFHMLELEGVSDDDLNGKTAARGFSAFSDFSQHFSTLSLTQFEGAFDLPTDQLV